MVVFDEATGAVARGNAGRVLAALRGIEASPDAAGAARAEGGGTGDAGAE